MTGTARVRLVNVRPRGATVVPLWTEVDLGRAFVETVARQTIDNHGDDFAGIAIVLWSRDNASTASISTWDVSRIPEILIPDFVRNRLLAQKIEQWTRMTGETD